MNLVTGSTGIVGIRIMLDLLLSEKKVKALHRSSSDLSVVKRAFMFYSPSQGQSLWEKIQWVEGDVLDIFSLEDAMNGCRHVYHCAAVVSFHPKDHDEMYRVNQIGTENVVNIAVASGIEKLCHISSIAAIGRDKPGAEITEKTTWTTSKYNSYYAVTKYGAECEVWRGAEEGLKVVVLNPGIIFGAGKEGKSSASLFLAIKQGLKFYTEGNGAFVDVRDVSQIACDAMAQSIENQRFIVVAENRSIRSVFNMIADNMNKPQPKMVAKKWLLSFGWRLYAAKDFFFGTRSPLTKESARSADVSFDFSNKKAKDFFKIDFISCQESTDYFSSFFL